MILWCQVDVVSQVLLHHLSIYRIKHFDIVNSLSLGLVYVVNMDRGKVSISGGRLS